jgi:hypothetical protein
MKNKVLYRKNTLSKEQVNKLEEIFMYRDKYSHLYHKATNPKTLRNGGGKLDGLPIYKMIGEIVGCRGSTVKLYYDYDYRNIQRQRGRLCSINRNKLKLNVALSREYSRQYYAKNRKKVLKRQSEYEKENREKINERRRQRRKIKKHRVN